MDLRLLGAFMRNHPVADVAGQLRVPKRWRFLTCRHLRSAAVRCKAEEYYYNAFFRVKVTLLLLIVWQKVFRRSVYDKVAEFDRDGRVLTGETGQRVLRCCGSASRVWGAGSGISSCR